MFSIPLLVLALLSITSHGIQNPQLLNSCGDIPNITFPFQLQPTNTPTCADNKNYTLLCQNNRTLLSLYSGKYYVNSINYNNYTIRLADLGIQSNICSSLPLHSLTYNNFTWGDPYKIASRSFIVFINCEHPVKSSVYINRTTSSDCNLGVNSKNYSYVIAGEVRVSDLSESCSVEKMVFSSELRERESNYSFLEINEALGDGFELSWEFVSRKKCEQRASCFGEDVNVTDVCSRFCNFEPSFLSNILMGLQVNILLVLVIIGAIIAARILCAPCVFGFLIYKFRRRHLSMFDSIEGFLQSQNNLTPIRYSYSDIRKMTKGFRDKLGEGGYGCVYKGKLRSGQLVAVKMLSKPKADGQEFISEVATIGRIHHVNVVRLIGYCAENSKRALVYDFMPNGSLEKYIFSQEGKISLSCEQMYEISLGVARGIEYLHRGCDVQILHFDIKPHNILLDEDFTLKVSDFGLAKLYPTDDSIVSLTAARGTLGYMAPELFYKNIGGISYKADIYSFGMLLMEMAGRRKNWNASADSSQIYFPSWVCEQFAEGRQIETGETTEEEREMVKKMMLVALWCIQMQPSDRPSMHKVVEMLEGNIEFLQMPPRPFLYQQQMQAENHGRSPNLSGACLESITLSLSAR